MKPARNAPCPCGSGKKYKKCCYLKEFDPWDSEGPPDSPREEEQQKPSDEQAVLLQMMNGLQKMILDRKPHIKEYYKIRKLHGEIVNAMIQHFEDGKFEQQIEPGFGPPDGHKPMLRALESDFDMGTQIGAHSLFDMLIYKNAPNANCITEEFLQKHRYRKPEKIEFLQSMLDSKLGLFEITRVDATEGYVYLKDVFTGCEHQIIDVGLSGNLISDKLYIYTRLIRYHEIGFGTGLNFVFSKNERFIQRHIKRYQKDFDPKGEFVRFIELYNYRSTHPCTIEVCTNSFE